MTDIEKLCRNLLTRMQEIDSNISSSMYPNSVHQRCHNRSGPLKQDEPPTGDDFNLLWDAIVDEIKAACPDLEAGKLLISDEPII